MLNLDQFEGHTRGPWFIPANGEIKMIYGSSEHPTTAIPGPDRICRVMDNAANNMPLIAAAPTLLEELKLMRELVKWYQERVDFDDQYMTLYKHDAIHDNHAFEQLRQERVDINAAITTLKERLGV